MHACDSAIEVHQVSYLSLEYIFLFTKHEGRCFQIELELRNVGFCGGIKIGVPREKPLGQGREPTTNSIHI